MAPLPPIVLPPPQPGPNTTNHPPSAPANPKPGSGTTIATLPPPTLPQPAAPAKPGSGGSIYGGTCTTDAATHATTCTGSDGKTCTTTTSDSCDPAKSGSVSPPPAPTKTANTTPVQTCQSNPQLPAWGSTSSSTMTVGAGSSCSIGWVDSNGVTLDQLSVKAQPSHGSIKLQGKGSLTYTAAPGYTGPDSFTISIAEHYRDGRSATAGSHVSVTIK